MPHSGPQAGEEKFRAMVKEAGVELANDGCEAFVEQLHNEGVISGGLPIVDVEGVGQNLRLDRAIHHSFNKGHIQSQDRRIRVTQKDAGTGHMYEGPPDHESMCHSGDPTACFVNFRDGDDVVCALGLFELQHVREGSKKVAIVTKEGAMNSKTLVLELKLMRMDQACGSGTGV